LVLVYSIPFKVLKSDVAVSSAAASISIADSSPLTEVESEVLRAPRGSLFVLLIEDERVGIRSPLISPVKAMSKLEGRESRKLRRRRSIALSLIKRRSLTWPAG
jgi:hypothetical protein